MIFSKAELLGDLIRERVPLGRLTSKGFYEHRCQLCNDRKTRAGWLIEPHQVFYNCYNCGFHASYEEGSGKFSRWMKEVLRANGIQDIDLQSITASLFFNKNENEEREITLETLRRVNLHTPEIAFPDRTFQLGSEGHDDLQNPIIEYLLNRRVDPSKFYFSLDPKHLRRAIVPYWRDGKLIFWQSRAIDAEVKPRYLNSSVSRDAVIYGYDNLFSYDASPLFVTEGVFDAISIDGICLLGSKLGEAKIELLKKTKRRIIFVVDRDTNGGNLGHTVLENGWELTFVDQNTKDINDSVCRYGKIYTVYSLMKNIVKQDGVEVSAPKIALDLELSITRMRKSKYV